MVYVVIDFDYVVAVFASKERADAYVANCEARSEYCGYTVEPHEVW